MKKVPLSGLSAIDRRLVAAAVAVRQKAYAPFSKYKCGAALLDIRNRMHVGCNIETIDFTLTTHAEMDAINDMIKTGVFRLKTIATAVLFSMVGYFNGNDKTVWVMVQGLIQTLLVRLPMAYFMSIQPNASLTMIGLAAPTSTLVGVVLNIGFYLYLQRQERKAA